jgi:hypothetical protein
MNAQPAALTARAAKRRGPPRRAFASFFQAEITLEKRKKEGTKCKKDNTRLGENYLREAVEKPGRMLEAYTAFHNFSFGNALLALEQCVRRNLQPGPLNTYPGWLEAASPQRGKRNHPLYANALQKSRPDRQRPRGGNSRTANVLRLPVSGVLVCTGTN